MTNLILAESAPAEIAPENAVPAAGGSVTVAVIVAVAVVVAVVLIAVAVFLWRRKKGAFPFDELGGILPRVAVSMLTFETVTKFFKEESRSNARRANADLLAVAEKKEETGGKTTVVLCLFDQKKGAPFDPETHAIVYVADALGSDLAEQFGDGQMIVLALANS